MKKLFARRTKRYLIIYSVILFLGHGKLFSANAYQVIPIEHGGELSGKILITGQPRSTPPHQAKSDANYCGPEIEYESNKVNVENLGLANTVVSLEGISRGKKHLPSTIPLEMIKCQFRPNIFTGVVGDNYGLFNRDPLLHNVHLRSGDTTIFNIALYPNGKKIVKPLTQPGVINVKCEIHPFMSATMVIFDHPYFTVTNQNGEYTISDIPAGKYMVRIWHEGISTSEKEVTINAATQTNLSVELSFP
ncbi:MAG: carboxypeptidase regulatory-like domain-containing protein [Nitrospiria bacterium]